MAQRYGVPIAAYVLMGNHYHLALQTPRANLSAAMKWLNVSYSAWHNRKYQRGSTPQKWATGAKRFVVGV